MYKVLKSAVPAEICNFLSQQLLLHSKVEQMRYNSNSGVREFMNEPDSKYPFGDVQVPKSFCAYGFNAFETLLLYCKPKIEGVVNSELLPTYSYGRIYYNNAELKKHRDRPSCELSASITLSTDGTPWSIFMDGKEVELDVGDLCVYEGELHEHWREPYKGEQHIQVFLHYVHKYGPYANDIFDGRPYVGCPK